MRPQLRAVGKGEVIHARELARRAIRDRAAAQSGGLAEVHDINRVGDPAPTLPVNDAVRGATFNAYRSQVGAGQKDMRYRRQRSVTVNPWLCIAVIVGCVWLLWKVVAG